ncbi:Slit 2 protein like [Actinidia chinensis var. chinensis]|uniref:Slit 2 protein like n=1 Tax=Actinidia chinensis var. chinensis TaxID=1590841 RepID=A0A2R6QL25_ACTCC|nr:Slit 2 protein like [Actinidia chinensis var. chinensis]
MASSNFMNSLAILLVLLPMIAKGDDNNLTPFYENMCNEVQCGRGSCKVAVGSPFNFKCECDSGWKRTRLDNESSLEFLPCIVPNCSVEYSCMPAAPPTPAIPYNLSFFDPCYWIYCGEGTCTKNLTYTHTCQCNNGYYNLLNVSTFPCYSDCAIGSDCEKLGITTSKSTSSTPSSSRAISILLGKFHWIAISLMSIAMVLWK